jgi:phospholipase/carboxylesterase
MMSLNVGLITEEKFNCIVGFSGKIIDQNNLKEEKKFLQKFINSW